MLVIFVIALTLKPIEQLPCAYSDSGYKICFGIEVLTEVAMKNAVL
jgi:hypothetical protein